MPGKVLIVDTIATNRIVLKVKLAAACYQVSQAATGADGLAMARKLRPDLILCAAHLPDMAAADFARSLRAHPATRSASLIVETVERNNDFRYDILSAGADDILLKPYPERLMLARLRSLLRLRESPDELHLRDGANQALGLAEDAGEFARPGRVAMIAPTAETALHWRHSLHNDLSGTIAVLPYKGAMHHLLTQPPPDAVALVLTAKTADTGLQILSDLRANSDTRDAGVLVLIEGVGDAKHADRLAAEVLDLGANGVLTEGHNPREIALRLTRQTNRKQMLDRLRSDMRDGLRAAVTDPLTGLYNRRFAMPQLDRIARKSVQTGSDFAAMVIDVDHFKLINDRFGHGIGDSVLMRLAETLRQAIEPGDLLARIGGEEFLVALPDTSLGTAHLVAKRLCRAVRDTSITVPGHPHPLQITVSIGVALRSDVDPAPGGLLPGQNGVPSLSTAVLERADKALYGAKAHGRNQVTLSNARSAA